MSEESEYRRSLQGMAISPFSIKGHATEEQFRQIDFTNTTRQSRQWLPCRTTGQMYAAWLI